MNKYIVTPDIHGGTIAYILRAKGPEEAREIANRLFSRVTFSCSIEQK